MYEGFIFPSGELRPNFHIYSDDDYFSDYECDDENDTEEYVNYDIYDITEDMNKKEKGDIMEVIKINTNK